MKDVRTAISRTGDTAQFNDIGVIEPLEPITINLADDEGRFDGKTTTGKSWATGGLINPCWALTNYHAVFGDIMPKGNPDSHIISFYVGVGQDGMGFANKVTGRVKYWGDLVNDGEAEDFAIINLNQCPGGEPEIGYHDISVADADTLKGKTVWEVGFSADMSGTDLNKMKPTSQECVVLGPEIGTGNFGLSCRTTGGASGSMVFAEVGGKKYIIAVAHAGKPKYSTNHKLTGYYTSAISITHLIRSINRIYNVNIENSILAYDQQYAPKTRPQD